jgi:hypothetical protein
MSTSANYGVLSATAAATATGSFSSAYFGNYGVTQAGQPNVQYTDKLTLTPTAAHPVGSVVPVTFTEAFSQSSFTVSGNSPANVAELLGTLSVTQTSGPAVQVNDIFGDSYQGAAPGNGAPDGPTGYSSPLPYSSYGVTYGSADSVSSTVDLEVGTPYVFTGGIYAVGQASATYDISEGLTDAANSVSESATANTLIDTYGLAYTTASGTEYATELPASVPDGGMTAAILGLSLLAYLPRHWPKGKPQK